MQNYLRKTNKLNMLNVNFEYNLNFELRRDQINL